MTETATTAVWNQIMRHDSNTEIFNTSYLNQRVQFDIQSAVMKRSSVNELICVFTHMSIECNSHTLKDVLKHIWCALFSDQNILNLEREWQALYKKVKVRYRFINQIRGTEIEKEYRKLVRKINSKKKKHKENLKKAYCWQYFYCIHNKTLEIVLNKIEINDYVLLIIQHQLSEQTWLQKIICDFWKDLSSLDIVWHQICTVNLLMTLCSQQEILWHLNTRP